MEKIMFATDGSISGTKAIEFLNHLLTAWPMAELKIVYVSDGDNQIGLAAPEEADAWMRASNVANQIYQTAREDWFPGLEHRLTFKHGFGTPAIVISTLAEEEGVDLLVLGHRQVGQPDPLLTGSVSHGVLYCTHVPVLVVKDWKGARDTDAKAYSSSVGR